MKTMDFLIANPQLEEFALNHYGYQLTGNRHIDCPICGKKKSFRINYSARLGRHGGICTCGSYTSIQLIQHQHPKGIGALLRDIDNLVGNLDFTKKPKIEPKSPAAFAIEKFKSGLRISGTPGHEYLKSRGIYSMPTGGAVYLPNEKFYDDDGNVAGEYGAIFCIAADALGRPIYSHTTYLKGFKKAELGGKERKQKSLIPDIHEGQSCSIKLFAKAEVMAVGEGIESCLAFAESRKMPTQSCLNTSILEKYRFDFDVRHGYVVADNDYSGAGLAAAYRCATMNIRQRPNLERVTIQWPETKGTDFNDALINSDRIIEDYVCRKPA